MLPTSILTRMGWDPYDLDASLQDQLFTLADQLGELSGEAFPVINASAPLEDSAGDFGSDRSSETQ